MVTYDSGANGHYLRETDRRAAGRLPILEPSAKRVRVAHGSTSHGTHVSRLPFPNLSTQASDADSFTDFAHSLMSVGKTTDDKTVFIFTQDSDTVHAEEDILITCHGEPMLIGVQDEHGLYRIPLCVVTQSNSHGRKPSRQATSMDGHYSLVQECIQGHLNHIRKNVHSIKPKQPFEELHSTQLSGHKECDICTKVYDTRETIFTDQTGKFPTRSQAGHQDIMIMVGIDSRAILFKLLKNRKDAELTQAYSNPMLRLHCAGIQPRKHIPDNEIYPAMKDLIQDKYRL
eukprot:CCRYP_007256-RA/>CCRYP_007256-RA protein AED:0.35 eAED:0.35 QI:0/0/0/1/0/0/4/0/286